ncbi:MAG: hypothetical protein ACNA8J_07520 [Gammaproteobacteria bacterium]
MTAPGIENGTGPAAPTGLLALLCLVAAGALGWLALAQPQHAWSPPPRLEVQLGDDYYRLDPARAAWIAAFAQRHFSAGHAAGRARLEAGLDAGLERMFDDVIDRLPEFGDWYYSLGGEYTRLSMAALARLGLAEDNFVAARAADILFPAEAWEGALGELAHELSADLRSHQEYVRAGWLAGLTQRLGPYRVPAPVAAGDRGPLAAVPIDDFGTQLLLRERELLETRIALSTLAAGGVAAGTAWRGAAARTAAGSGRAAAGRGVGRGAARAGAAAGGGMTACAPAGPYALGCAVVAGAVAWLATDWALLRIDEAMNREALLAAMAAGVHELRLAMRQEVLAAYDAVTAEYHAGVEDEIANTFRPVHAGSRPVAIVHAD